MKMQTPSIAAKAKAATLAAALTPLLINIVKTAYPQLPLPGNAGDIIGAGIEGLVLLVSVLTAAYVTPPAAQDQIIPSPQPQPIQYAPVAAQPVAPAPVAPQPFAPQPVAQPVPVAVVTPAPAQAPQQAVTSVEPVAVVSVATLAPATPPPAPATPQPVPVATPTV